MTVPQYIVGQPPHPGESAPVGAGLPDGPPKIFDFRNTAPLGRAGRRGRRPLQNEVPNAGTTAALPAKRDQFPISSVIARPVRAVAIRIFPAPEGPGGALRRRGYGLPRSFAPRNDGCDRCPLLSGESVSVGAGLPDGPPKIFDFRKPAPLGRAGRRGRRPLRSEFHTPSGDCQIRTMPDHTSSARLSTSKTSDSLTPGPAGIVLTPVQSYAIMVSIELC